jgi:hypothetical protein
MTQRLHLYVFTPTHDNLLRHETVTSLVAQQTTHLVTWEIGRCNPYPGRDMRNVLAQYSMAREMCLNGPYDALLTVEHDMVIPLHAVQALCDTPAPVVYGTYLLRHGEPVLNAWRYEGTAGLGMSLGRPQYAVEFRKLREAGVGRVSGCGFGCTLIRREVLEAIPFRADAFGHAPDMPFAIDCVHKDILQLARFDVRCGHIDKGVTMEIQGKSDGKVTVTCIQPINILVEGSGVSLVEGDTIELPPEQAQWLASQGYVEVVKEPTPRSGEAGMTFSGEGSEHGGAEPGLPTAPKIPRKPA